MASASARGFFTKRYIFWITGWIQLILRSMLDNKQVLFSASPNPITDPEVKGHWRILNVKDYVRSPEYLGGWYWYWPDIRYFDLDLKISEAGMILRFFFALTMLMFNMIVFFKDRHLRNDWISLIDTWTGNRYWSNVLFTVNVCLISEFAVRVTLDFFFIADVEVFKALYLLNA